MAVSGEPAELLVPRFVALREEFTARGLRMHEGAYNQLAVLSFLEHSPVQIADRVLDHRAVMAALKPNPGREMTFDLAVGTAFLDLVHLDRDLREISDLSNLLQIQAVIQAQQVAVISVVVVATT